MSTIHYISIIDLDTKELRRFEVPRSVSVYVKQLEHKVWQLSGCDVYGRPFNKEEMTGINQRALQEDSAGEDS